MTFFCKYNTNCGFVALVYVLVVFMLLFFVCYLFWLNKTMPTRHYRWPKTWS